MAAAWATSISSSRAMEGSVRWRRAAAIARAWSAPIRPSRQASAVRGRWRSVLPRRVRRRAARRGTRQRVAIHAEAVLAPSPAHSPPASKAAVASVTKASKRASWPKSTSIDAPSP